jgi:hypothetical protein
LYPAATLARGISVKHGLVQSLGYRYTDINLFPAQFTIEALRAFLYPGHMSDRTEIIEFVNSIFDAVDAQEWEQAKACFESTVAVDFTSLNGGEPETVTRSELVDGWRKGLRDGKESSFHLVGNYRISIDQENALARLKGYAWNLNPPEFGGALWEAWGSYEIPLHRTSSGWIATGMSFFASHTRRGKLQPLPHCP